MGAGSVMLSGVLRYEALMAVRQRMLWIVLCPLAALIAVVALTSPAGADGDATAGVALAALGLSAFYTMGVGVALADGVVRQHASLGELLETTPASSTLRLLGAVWGPLAVALIPAAAVLLIAGIVGAVDEASAEPLGAAGLAFLTTLAPGAWALTAFGVLLSVRLPLVLARVAVVVCWGWATLLSPGLSPVPTATGTVLSPLGGYPAVAWLGAPSTWADRGASGVLRPAPGTMIALLNVGATLLAGVVLLGLARLLLSRSGKRTNEEDDR